jgi:uncharacterized protein YhhL (DUF1145 family)
VSQEVQLDEALWKKLVPEVESKIVVSSAQPRDEMVLDMWWRKLKINIFGIHEILQGERCFVV